jgi:hypothetical protein
MMHSSELPTCLIEKVAKIGDRAFLAIMVAHHLWRARRKEVSSGHHLAYFFVPLGQKGRLPRPPDPSWGEEAGGE